MHQHFNGVKFYSVNDLSSGWYLEKAEKVLNSFSPTKEYTDANEIIELYNIKQYLDNDMRLAKWEDNTFYEYKELCKSFDQIMAIFFSKNSDEGILGFLEVIDYEYIDDFWILVNKYKLYERLSEATFRLILQQSNIHLRPILSQKEIVTRFGHSITEYLTSSQHSAELLIDYYLAEQESSRERLFFPHELTNENKVDILLRYIASTDAHPGYLGLIADSQSIKELPLSDKIKLEAKKQHRAFVTQHLAHERGFKYGASVAFSDTQDEEIIITNPNSGNIDVSYSTKWFKENLDFPTLLNNFIHLFGFVDGAFRSSFVSLPTEMGVLETHMGVHGKREYQKGIHFDVKHMLYDLQMQLYYQELLNLDIRLESVFKWFFEEYLVNEFHAAGFYFNAASIGVTELEKCKLLASEIDSILKQFSLYVQEGHIDRDLFEVSSGHRKFENVPSLLSNKYVYPKSDICRGCMNLLFSDQSGLSYTEKTKSDYENLFELIRHQIMLRNDFAEYQKRQLDWLAQQGCIHINENDIIKLNEDKTFIFKELYYKQVGCLCYYRRLRPKLDAMAANGDIEYVSSLFSKPEQAYLNYILNKAEYSNGPDLRNKYLHGNYSLKIDAHLRDYIQLLKIMTLIIIKINEEFCLSEILKRNSGISE